MSETQPEPGPSSAGPNSAGVIEDERHQSQKMEALGRLAGGVAHDFNNLLTAINGYADLLLATLGAQDPHRELAEEIRKAGEKGAALTRQLLAFSRKQKAEIKPQDIRPILQDLEKLLTRLLPPSLRLENRTDPVPRLARVDRGLLEQALINLVVNARDASPQGGLIDLAVETARIETWPDKAPLKPPPGDYVLIHVSDKGMGMGPEVMEHLFEPFFTTKGKGRGTGLGLSTVYGIMKQLDGGLRVRSELGRGSTFTLCLPAATQEAAPTIDEEVRVAPHGRGETVALVETDDAVRRLTHRILQEAGYAVVELSQWQSIAAASGFDAAVVARSTSITASLAQELLDQGHARAVIVLGISSGPDTARLDLSQAEDAQASTPDRPGSKVKVLPKPFRPGDLLAVLHQALAEG